MAEELNALPNDTSEITKNTKILITVKGQGHMSLKLNYFYEAAQHIFVPSDVNFCSVIFQLSRRHTDRQEWD